MTQGMSGWRCLPRALLQRRWGSTRGQLAPLWSWRGFFCDRVGGVAGDDPTCRPGDYGFMLEPEESEVVDALGEVRLDDDVARNHCARNVRVVGAVVAICPRCRDRTDAGYVGSAGYRVRSEDVIDRAESVFGAYKIRKGLVQEIHPRGHVYYAAGSAPCPEARGHAERRGVQLLVETRHVGLD